MVLPLLALSTAGMLTQAYGQMQQGRAARDAANFSARLSEQEALAYEQNATVAIENASRGVEAVRRSFVASEGDLVAAFAANGMDVGSATALAYLAQGAREANYDANLVRESYGNEARENMRQADISRQTAQFQRISGQNVYRNSRLQAAGTIIGGLGNIGLMYSSIPPTAMGPSSGLS